MNKSNILNFLNKHIDNELNSGKKISNRRKKLLNALQNASEEDVIVGDCPKYFYAILKCNSTGVGTSSFEGSKTQRTVALDYTTDEYLFIDGHEGAAVKGLEIFHLNKGETVNYYKERDMAKVAKAYGVQLHLQQFRDLNFSLNNHRLNRYSTQITKDVFSYPIYPIFVSVIEMEKPIFVGYVYKMEGEEYIIIELNNSETTKTDSIFSLWMLLGLIFPPVIIVAIIVLLYRIINR